MAMSDFEDLGASDSTIPETPATSRRFSRESQVDFEIELYRQLLKRDPHYVDVMRVLATNLAAKGLHDESLDVDERLVRLRPNDQVALYNLACSYSMVGLVDASLELLRRAIESGYDEFEYMQHDADLETLRRDPRFKELLVSLGVK
jgi:tetratricopeptide (TPR) repeat protein